MHIAIDVRSLMEGRHSGVEEYTVQITRAMAKVAPRHTYHLFYNSARPVELPSFPANTVTHAFHFPNKVLNAVQWATSYPRWDSLVHADVFFVPNVRLIPLHQTTPLVSVAHDATSEKFPEFFDARRRMWHEMMRSKSLMKRSNHIIAVSEHTKNDLVSLYDIDSSNISVVHSGISKSFGHIRSLDVQRVRQRYALPSQYILFLGAFEPRKNIVSIVEAFSAIADRIPHDLVIAGERGWQQDRINKVIETSSHRHRIHLPGFIVEEDKAPLYAAANLFVYPSFYEGFGFPPLEALASGTPVITSFNSALPEVVGKWATLVDPYNVTQLTRVMLEVLQDNSRISDDVKRAIREEYSWEAAANKTIACIESVVGRA